MPDIEKPARDDIYELISFAKENLQFKKISVITNGSRFSDGEFAAKAIDCGIDEVLFRSRDTMLLCTIS